MKKAVSILLTFILIFSCLTVFSDCGYMSEDETVITSITDEKKICGYAENSDSATLILAYYSQNGRLLETRITTEAKTPYINIDSTQPNGYFELFVLDSINGLSPLTQIPPLLKYSPMLIYSYKNSASNSNNQPVHRVNGYLFGENEDTPTTLKTKMSTDTTTFTNSFTGDLYKIAYTNTDYNHNSQKILSVSDKTWSAFYENNNGYEMAHGLLYSATEEEFVIANTHDVDEIEDADKYTFTLDEDAVFVTYNVYESDNYKLYATTDNMIMAMTSYEISKFMPEELTPDEVFVYAIDGKTILVYQIIR